MMVDGIAPQFGRHSEDDYLNLGEVYRVDVYNHWYWYYFVAVAVPRVVVVVAWVAVVVVALLPAVAEHLGVVPFLPYWAEEEAEEKMGRCSSWLQIIL